MTLHEQVRYRGVTLQYRKLQFVTQPNTMVKSTMTETCSAVLRSRRNCSSDGAERTDDGRAFHAGDCCVCRVVAVLGRSSCGRRATAGLSTTTATAMATPTASTRCPSAARRRTAPCRGTPSRALPPSRRPTAAERSTTDRSYAMLGVIVM